VPNYGAFYVGNDGVVLASLEASPPHRAPDLYGWRGSSTGVLILRKELLKTFNSEQPLSLERTVLPQLIRGGMIRGFDNGQRYFLDFGTPMRLASLNP
jgi:NDP-sugar pyrophosphorylase family protein